MNEYDPVCAGPVADRDYRISSACGVIGMMNEQGGRVSGRDVIQSIALMHERSNGLGGGFAAYGIYPEYKNFYAFHMMYENEEAKKTAENYLEQNYEIKRSEPIPIKEIKIIKSWPIIWRYFLKPFAVKGNETEQDFVVRTVMFINQNIKNAFVASSGKNMGIFKGVGYPEDIGEFFRLEEYKAYTWTAHGRFPTNSVAWWGGSHPFGILDWSIVHNGEISSYGINKRYLENYGYKCSFFTDTEVITYLFDLLSRKHELSFEILAKVLSAPFWKQIDRMPQEEKEFYKNLRIVYSSALVNGPFAVIAANNTSMVGLNDRIKLRPLVAARKGDIVYVSSEESAIREICAEPDQVWSPKAGEPVIARLKS
ncbi:MAG: glutamine amidotransferase family protein [Elusimicrobia bacterium]|nr:glutamine amidotransferase family protein [Elusimicrobiota bacterium]MBU2615277.1 glutamine amidotransferase family protein [Elusimicrobiota bacterium]